MEKWIAFAIVTAVLIFISRRSLTRPGSHGFYRFFAWEAIAGLVLLNIGVWFKDPLAWYQVISWVLLFASLVPLGFGVRALVTRGKPAQRAGEPDLLAFEKTTQLVTTGIYGTIRHPLYSSLLILAWGVFFKAPGWAGLLLAAAATAALVLTARADEAECARFFGERYVEYMKKTKRFIPWAW